MLLVLVFNQAIAQDKTHKIKSGETLSSIAKLYKTTIADLQRLNPETKSGIRAGATLVIPGKADDKPSHEPESTSGTSGETHVVKSGESLSRIAKKYKVSVSDLEKWNNVTAKTLKAGQELQISGPATHASSERESPQEETATSIGTSSHTVVKGQTLSQIAREYGISLSELKKMNNLLSNKVNLGQVLKVPSHTKEEGQPKMDPPAKAEPAPKVVAQPKDEPRVEDKPKSVQPASSKVADPVVPATSIPEKTLEPEDGSKQTSGIKEVSNTLGYTRVLETGFAEAIEGEGNSKKHLCLHKTAPVGSILQVRNEVNGQSVFVKVIGKLPETGSNEKLIIRISRQAYDKLLAVGKRFPVEVSYPLAQ